MVPKVILTIGSLLFLSLLLVTYYSKKFKLKLNNRIYRYLIVLSIILLVTEFAYAVVFEVMSNKFLFVVLWRLHWISSIVLFLFMYYYVLTTIKDYPYKDLDEFIKNTKGCKYYSLFTLVCIIVFIFLPFTDMTIDTFSFIPGTAAYFCVGYFVVTMAIIIVEVQKTGQVPAGAKLAFLGSIVSMVLVTVLQLLYPEISFFDLLGTLVIFFFYFLIENPDLRLIEEIDELKLTVERSSKAKSDFLSNMSHEIRSPMNAIIGFSETIIADKTFDSNKVLNDINHIKSSSKNLLDIIDNILDISKIETGTDTIENKNYSLKELLIDWTGIVETRLEGKKIKFILEAEQNLPSKYVGDSTKIFQIVLNILTNAVKYTEVGRIKMTLIGERLSDSVVKLKFKVSDTGFGIKKEDYSKVFQKFSRLDQAKTNEIEGTGLGLVLSKRYTELMGGKIWFESEYGAGTTFYLEIPQRVLDNTPLGNINESIEESNNRQLLDCTGTKVLVVDDDELNQRVTKRLLGAYNIEVETISDPEECIYKIKAGNQYDLIFLDHIMHNMSGVELLKVLKSLPGYKIPPVVMLTANAITGVREMYLKEGFDEYLSKPIDINELDKIVNMFLKK